MGSASSSLDPRPSTVSLSQPTLTQDLSPAATCAPSSSRIPPPAPSPPQPGVALSPAAASSDREVLVSACLSTSPLYSVVVFGSTFSGWLPFCAAHRLSVSLVVVTCSTLATALGAVGFQVQCLPLPAWPSVLAQASPDLLLIDGRFTAALATACEQASVSVALCTKGARLCPSGWELATRRLRHHLVGGVTDKEVTFYCFARHRVQFLFTVVPVPSLTVALHSALDDTVSARFTRAHPSPLDAPSVVNLGSPQAPFFHADGFLPATFRRNVRVLAPSCCLPSHRWALRRLTDGEWFNVFDIPAVPPWNQLLVPTASTIPGKLYDAALTTVTEFLSGGGPLFSLSTEAPATAFEPLAFDPGIVGDRFENYPAAYMDELEQDLNFAERRHWAAALDCWHPTGVFSATRKVVVCPSWDVHYAGLPCKHRTPTQVTWAPVLSFDIEALGKHGVDSTRQDINQLDAGIEDLGSHGEVSTQQNIGQVDAGDADDSNDFSRTGLKSVLKAEDDGDRMRREQKATKADDAAVPEYLWLEKADPSGNWARHEYKGLERFQRSMLVYWKKKIWQEGMSLLRKDTNQDGTTKLLGLIVRRKDDGSGFVWGQMGRAGYKAMWKKTLGRNSEEVRVVVDALTRAARATWWEWVDGSAPFFWRWPKFYQKTIREGLEVHFVKSPPRNTKPQRSEKNEEVREKVKAKLSKVRKRRYIAPGQVLSLTSYFAVPKGETDIRMVYDGTASGLNDSIWVPNFGVPTVQTHLRMIGPTSWMVDLDVGEMFLNFFLHLSLQALAGVDFTPYFGDGRKCVWETWYRAAMGLKSLPYQATQALEVAEEVVRGDRHDPGNIFRWAKVELNLPGSPNYDPTKPWVMKLRLDSSLAADFVTYIDDMRPVGNTEAEAWWAAQQIGKALSFLGVQSASRKRRSGSQQPGAWAGALVISDGKNVWITVSQEKWEKVQSILARWEEKLLECDGEIKLDRKQLERDHGFLNYVVQTYSFMTPYLIGFHMTIDSWRSGRDEDGWRIPGASTWLDEEEQDVDVGDGVGPAEVTPVPRFKDDIQALRKLTSREVPIWVRARARDTAEAFYGFGDALRSGFGASLKMGEDIWVQYGNWSREVRENSTSNWRELSNLVGMIKQLTDEGDLAGAELFIFTDNSTAEAAYSKGSSKSRKLFELVLELKVLEAERDVHIHVIHVSGKRMIHQGTDGLSRADKSTGVMAGHDMMSFVPLHQSVWDRCPMLVNELESRLPRGRTELLLATQWYEHESHGNINVWLPPPAAADVVAEQLMKARHKRPHQLSIVIVPRLFTGRWRRQMGKCTDGNWVLKLPHLWLLTSNYEPLLIFIALPFRSEAPAFERRRALLEEFGGILSGEDVSEEASERRWDLLCEFLRHKRVFSCL